MPELSDIANICRKWCPKGFSALYVLTQCVASSSFISFSFT